MLKLLDKILLLLTFTAVAGLTGAYTARYVNPSVFVWPSLLGLAYPYLLILNFILLLYWTGRRKKTAFLSLAVIGLGIPVFMSYYGTNGNAQKATSYDWSVLSYNVRYFDRYGWNKDKKTKMKLIDYLNRVQADVVCLQEFPTPDYSLQPEGIIRELSSYRYHSVYKNMAVFSRYPLLQGGQIRFDPPSTGSCQYCDIVKDKDTVRFYNIHLESYKLGDKERKIVKNITAGNTDGLSGGLKTIFSRILSANKNRAAQVLQFRKHLLRSPYKTVVCGDFNDTPLSYTYQKMRQGLKDSFIEKGQGLGNTYIGEFPSFRIDYILHTPEFQTAGYSRDNIALSDHYPIRCTLLKKK